MFILLFTIHYYLLFYYYLLFITSYYYYYYLLFIAIYIVIVIYVIVIVLHSMQKSSWRLWDIGSVVKEVGKVVGLDILKVISNLNDSMFLWKNIKQQIEKKKNLPTYAEVARDIWQNQDLSSRMFRENKQKAQILSLPVLILKLYFSWHNFLSCHFSAYFLRTEISSPSFLPMKSYLSTFHWNWQKNPVGKKMTFSDSSWKLQKVNIISETVEGNSAHSERCIS